MTLKLREARRMLKQGGFDPSGVGKHERWSHPDGRTVTLPHKPKGDGLYGFMERKIRAYANGDGTYFERNKEG